MKKKIIFLLFILLYINNIYGQSFNKLIRKADSSYRAKNYIASGQFFEQAFKLNDSISYGNYYKAACIWALADEKNKSIEFLWLSAENGYHDYKWIQHDPDLEILHNSSEWEKILTKVNENRKIYERDFDTILQHKLELIYVKDQTLRALYRDANKKFGRESDEMNYFWSLMSYQDSLNVIDIIKIIEKNGWPGKSLVGEKANIAIWLVIQHASLDIQKKYLPLLQESVRKGESNGKHLALLTDRILMREGKKQIYGTQIINDPKTGKSKVYPIDNPQNVNKLRAKVGLGNIEDYLNQWNIKWTK